MEERFGPRWSNTDPAEGPEFELVFGGSRRRNKRGLPLTGAAGYERGYKAFTDRRTDGQAKRLTKADLRGAAAPGRGGDCQTPSSAALSLSPTFRGEGSLSFSRHHPVAVCE